MEWCGKCSQRADLGEKVRTCVSGLKTSKGGLWGTVGNREKPQVRCVGLEGDAADRVMLPIGYAAYLSRKIYSFVS